MNIGSIGNVIGMLRQLTDVYNSTEAAYEPTDVKPRFMRNADSGILESASPESQGISSELIYDYIRELRDDKSIEIQNIMILRNSKKVFEISFDDQNINLWKSTFSASKSIISLAVGYAVDERYFSVTTPITDIFGDEMNALSKRTMKDVTVGDLLTMRSAVSFDEAESMVSNNWKHSFLTSALKGTPGKVFNYNSMNTYMLAAMIVKLTGKSVVDFLKPRLFDPLGISDIYWEKSPEGIEKGGWGLFIRPEDMAKIGLCMLNSGKWEGKEVIPPAWIREATYRKTETPKDAGSFDYGYQIWCGRDTDTFLFNGMFGQNMLAFRDHGIVIISNCANSEVFQGSNFYSTTLKYFCYSEDRRISRESMAENPEAFEKLLRYGQSQRIGRPEITELDSRCHELDGLEIFPMTDAASSVGILPLALQIVENNYTKGIKSVRFEIKDGKFYVICREADAIHRLPIGFSRPLSVNMSFRGSYYRVAVSGEFTENEDRIPVFKIRLCFAETPFVRVIKMFFDGDDITLVFSESPTETFVIDNIMNIKESLLENMLLKGTINKIDDDYLEYKILRTFHPSIRFSKEKDETERNRK